MAGSINKVILVGRLGKDPEERSFPSGGKVVSFSLATGESWTDKATGERKEKTEWHNISIFNENLGRIAMQYLRKGSRVYLEGQIQTRKWQDKDGNDRYTTEVVLQRFRGELTLLDSKGGSIEASNDDYSAPAFGKTAAGGASGGNLSGGFGGAAGTDLDDEIPF